MKKVLALFSVFALNFLVGGQVFAESSQIYISKVSSKNGTEFIEIRNSGADFYLSKISIENGVRRKVIFSQENLMFSGDSSILIRQSGGDEADFYYDGNEISEKAILSLKINDELAGGFCSAADSECKKVGLSKNSTDIKFGKTAIHNSEAEKLGFSKNKKYDYALVDEDKVVFSDKNNVPDNEDEGGDFSGAENAPEDNTNINDLNSGGDEKTEPSSDVDGGVESGKDGSESGDENPSSESEGVADGGSTSGDDNIHDGSPVVDSSSEKNDDNPKTDNDSSNVSDGGVDGNGIDSEDKSSEDQENDQDNGGADNSSGSDEEKGGENDESSVQPRPSKKISQCSDLKFSEIFANSQEQFIEIYNSSNDEILLDDCGILVNKMKNPVYFTGEKVGANEFFVVESGKVKLFKQAKNFLKIVDIEGEVYEKIEFEKTKPESSFSKIGEKWVQTFEVTKGSKNIFAEFPPCLLGMVRSENGRCVKDSPVDDVFSEYSAVGAIKNVGKTEKNCGDGYFLNEKTNRCNKIKEEKTPARVGRRGGRLASSSVKNCESGYFLNTSTNRCNKIKAEKSSNASACGEGQ